MGGRLDDAARFEPDDVPDVVAAAFACPLCLHAPGTARLRSDPYAPFVTCGCNRCAATWSVHLRAFQYLRLRLAPPPELQHLELDATSAQEPRYWRW